MRFSPARRAFTLIEILVVLGVIVLLSALAFPIFARVREGGRRTVCQSNLQQLGVAFQQYLQDSNGRYPFSGDYYEPKGAPVCFGAMCYGWSSSTGTGNANWVSGGYNMPLADAVAPFAYKDGNTAQPENGSLFPYVKKASMYYCPSNKDGEKKRLSYSMNCALTYLDNRRVRTPADIVLLVDEEYANDGYFFAVNDGQTTPAVDNWADSVDAGGARTNSTDALTVKHGNGGNLLFTDGHVKYFSKDAFPIDDTPQGKANKWKTAGSPRFHDRAFGKWGSSIPAQLGGEIATDYCNAKAGPGSDDGTKNR